MKVCSIADCDRPLIARSYCGRHYQRWRKHGDPEYVYSRKGARHPMWRGDDAGYKAVHLRLGKVSGPCVDCGAPAKHWSYTHADPAEKKDPYPYSTDPTYYVPRCRSCHSKLDRNREGT